MTRASRKAPTSCTAVADAGAGMNASTSVQLSRHADNLDAVRARFSRVMDASAYIAQGDGAYGLLCGWNTESLEERHVRQDELVAYVADNLRLIGQGLRKAAKAYDETWSEVADAVGQAPPAAGASLIAAPVTPSREFRAVEQVESIPQMLDALTGRPEVVASHAETWCNIAVELRSMCEDLEDFVERDLPDWHGDAADEHQRLMTNNVEAVGGLSAISAALSELTEAVGVLVDQTRRIVRDLVADLMAWVNDAMSAEPHRMTAAPATFARWAGRTAVYTTALHLSVTHIEQRLNG